MITENLYNAFTKISPRERMDLINFFYTHLGEEALQKNDIHQALDYAVKDCPSFGGFVLTAELNGDIVCAAVVNETGMGSYYARNIMVLFAIDAENIPENTADSLLKRAADYARGDIILRLSPENPAFDIIESFGFEATHLEMRFADLRVATVRNSA